MFRAGNLSWRAAARVLVYFVKAEVCLPPAKLWQHSRSDLPTAIVQYIRNKLEKVNACLIQLATSIEIIITKFYVISCLTVARAGQQIVF